MMMQKAISTGKAGKATDSQQYIKDERNRQSTLRHGPDVTVPRPSAVQAANPFSVKDLEPLAAVLGHDRVRLPRIDYRNDADVSDVVNRGKALGGHRWYRDWSDALESQPAHSNHDPIVRKRVFGATGQGTAPAANYAYYARTLSRHHHGLADSAEQMKELNHLGILPALGSGMKAISEANLEAALHDRDLSTTKLMHYTSGFMTPEQRAARNIAPGAPLDIWGEHSFTGSQAGPSGKQDDWFQGRMAHHREAHHPDLDTGAHQAAHWVGYKRRLGDHIRGMIDEAHQKFPATAAGVGTAEGVAAFRNAVNKAQNYIGAVEAPGDVHTVLNQYGMKNEDGTLKPLPLFATHELIGRHLDTIKSIAHEAQGRKVKLARYEVDNPGAVRELLDRNQHLFSGVDDEHKPRLSTAAELRIKTGDSNRHYLHGDVDATLHVLRNGKAPSYVGYHGAKTSANAPTGNPDNHNVKVGPQEDFRIHYAPARNSDEVVNRHLQDPAFRSDMARISKILDRKVTGKNADPWTRHGQEAGKLVQHIATQAAEESRRRGEYDGIGDGIYAQRRGADNPGQVDANAGPRTKAVGAHQRDYAQGTGLAGGSLGQNADGNAGYGRNGDGFPAERWRDPRNGSRELQRERRTGHGRLTTAPGVGIVKGLTDYHPRSRHVVVVVKVLGRSE